jgi:hypothetical protein
MRIISMNIVTLTSCFERYLHQKNENFPNKHLLNLKKQASDFEQATLSACSALKHGSSCQPAQLRQLLIDSVLICMPGRFPDNNPMAGGGALSIKASPLVSGKAAWQHIHDFQATANYIQAFIGHDVAYYYLRAFYKLVASRNEFLHHCQGPVLEQIKTYKGHEPFDASARLIANESRAIQLAYYAHPSGEELEQGLDDFFKLIAQMINKFDLSNESLAANFCYKIFTTGILLHPFVDGNYRSLSILVNALLDRAGYEFINFYDNEVRDALALPFAAEKHDRANGIAVLTACLIKKPHQSSLEVVEGTLGSGVLFNHASLFKKLKTNDPGQAIRRAAASNYVADLTALLEKFPQSVNDGASKTALDWAIEKGHGDCEVLLRNNGGQEAKVLRPSS